MCFLKKFFTERRRKKQNTIEQNQSIGNDILTATREFEAFFADQNRYINCDDIDKWKEKWHHLISAEALPRLNTKKKTALEIKTHERIGHFQQRVAEIDQQVDQHNEAYIAFRLENLKKMILPIEGKSLDTQQLTCILKEGRNHIVVAGAGTGKTITVIGKIKFLLKAEKFKPEQILVLSFTNASAGEMRQRINKETAENIDALTFHKLGMMIITEVNGAKPNITQINLTSFVKQTLNQLVKDPVYLKKFIQYLCFYRIKQKSAFDFTDKREYDDYLATNQPGTMKNEVVKSYGEMEIANYLYQNGINYQYERPYPIDTATKEYAQYRPDFYLPDADLYIEYYAINRKGEVPPYFKGKANKSAKQSYQEGIVWKRQLHAENETTLLELFAYEHLEGKLLQVLEEKLKAAKVVFNPKSDDQLWAEIRKTHGSFFDNLGQLFETVISLVKINNDPFDRVYELNRLHYSGHQFWSNYKIIELIEPVYKAYAFELQKNNEIDFNDMINLATQYVANGQYRHHYGYVIVDEYQDISRARYNLLKAMRDQSEFGLFCVGDDWQSIYGFAGSDISYILDFESYWGSTEESKIETTYRFSKSLIAVSGEFVMKNPRQIKKKLSATTAGATHSGDGFSLGLIEGHNDKSMITALEAVIRELPQNSSVFFIGRYNQDIKLLEQLPFICRYDNKTAKNRVYYQPRSDLQMTFLSAHRSKGLQADYVFILNNKGKSHGFPSKLQNDDVVQLLLEDTEDYLYAEERRLFYVAITRTRKKAWLLVQHGNQSIFVQELMAGFPNDLKSSRVACPECGGSLVLRNGAYGEFWGCSNYHKGCTYKKPVAAKKGPNPKSKITKTEQVLWKPAKLVGEKVTHVTFGEGTINSIENHYVTVKFKVTPRKFVYPDAFGTVLLLKNPEQRQIVSEIVKRYEKKLTADVPDKGLKSQEIGQNPLHKNKNDQPASKSKTNRNQDLESVKTMKIGEIARTILRNRLENGHLKPDEIELMQTKDYSKEVFGIQFPLLLKTKNPSGDRPIRYYAEPLKIQGEFYYLCSEWYEVPANNDRPLLMKWLILHE